MQKREDNVRVNEDKRVFLRSLLLLAGSAVVLAVLSKVQPLAKCDILLNKKKKAKIRVTEDGSLVVG